MCTSISDKVKAIQADVDLSNNGWSDIGPNASQELTEALQSAGLVVVGSTNAHGRPTLKAYSQKAQAALRHEHARGSELVRPVFKSRLDHCMDDAPDYEAAILAGQPAFI